MKKELLKVKYRTFALDWYEDHEIQLDLSQIGRININHFTNDGCAFNIDYYETGEKGSERIANVTNGYEIIYELQKIGFGFCLSLSLSTIPTFLKQYPKYAESKETK